MQDVGQAILESYSRVIESLAFTVLSRIEDVMLADSQATNDASSVEEKKPSPVKGSEKIQNPSKEDNSGSGTPTSMTLLDFMGWNTENQTKRDDSQDEDETIHLGKPANVVTTNKRASYIENLGGCRSPTARH